MREGSDDDRRPSLGRDRPVDLERPRSILQERKERPAFDAGLKVGVVLATFTIGSFFVGPLAPWELSPGGGPSLISAQDGPPAGPIPYVAPAALVLGFATTIAFPLVADEVQDGYHFDVLGGLVVPTILGVTAAALVLLLFPVAHYLLAGEFVTALVHLGVVLAAVAVVVYGWMVSVFLILMGLLFLVGPALVGVLVGRGLVGVGRWLRP